MKLIIMVEVNRDFEGRYCFYYQGERGNETSNHQEKYCKHSELSASFFVVVCLAVTSIKTELIIGFPRSFPENSRIVPLITPRPLSSTNFPIHNSLIISPFVAI
jgi:hypothetical protein